MSDELDELDTSTTEENPDHLLRKPIDVTDDDWKQHRNNTFNIIRGIQFRLKGRQLQRDVMNDLISDAFVRMLSDKDKNPYWAGVVSAQSWLRSSDFKQKKTGQKIKYTPRIVLATDMSRTYDEGDEVEFFSTIEDTAEKVVLDDAGCKVVVEEAEGGHSTGRAVCIYILRKAQQQLPADYNTVIEHLDRKHAGGCFTRAENTRYESAMRRLRKLVLQLAPKTEDQSWDVFHALLREAWKSDDAGHAKN